jgi:hypothetical protein
LCCSVIEPCTFCTSSDPSGAPEFTPGFSWGSCYAIFGVMCMFCSSLFVLFLLAIVLSVLLWFTDSNYLFGIFKLFYGRRTRTEETVLQWPVFSLLKKHILIHIGHPETYWLNILVVLTPFIVARNENKNVYMY